MSAPGADEKEDEQAPERVSLEARREIMAEAGRIGGETGALHAHSTLPPFYWGTTRYQFFDFMGVVRSGVEDGAIINSSPAKATPYPQEKFEVLGPNAYQVCKQIIKPLSDGSATVLPFCSYALQKNPEFGAECNLFISHAWSEGLFELDHTLKNAWLDEDSGAYLCFLANPQNLDISALVSKPESSPFYRVLQSKPRLMIMAANSNDPIHSRLWCCLEAFCSVDFAVPVVIAGDPIWLVHAEQRESASKAIAAAVSAQHKQYGALGDGLHAIDDMQSATQELHAAFENIAIKTKDAACYSNDDKQMILALIGDRTSDVDAMIKQQMVCKADEAVRLAFSGSAKR